MERQIMGHAIHKKLIKRKIAIGIVILSSACMAMLVLLNAGRLFHAKTNDRWDSDQTNIIQYLYPASLCVRLAEQHQIGIDPKLKGDLEKYTRKLFKKLTLDKLYSTQIGQLVWLNDYYHLNASDKLLSELTKFYSKEVNLYSFDRESRETADTFKNMIFTTCELYGYLKDNPENLTDFKVTEGLSDFLNHFNNIGYYGWGTVWQAASILMETGHDDRVDRDRIRGIIRGALLEDLFQNLMKGQYNIELSMISVASSLSDYMTVCEDNMQYQYLCQEIYNKIGTADLIAYGKSDSLFPLYLASIRVVKDWSKNPFICSNYNSWLTENYHNAMEKTLVEALGK